MAQLIKPQIKWTEDKIKLLKDEYPNGNKNELAKKLGIKRSTLKDAARRFKVVSLTKNKKQCEKLLDGSLLSYYWHGFLIGDGNISSVGRFVVTLAIKDKEHLQKYNNWIPGKLQEYTTSIDNEKSYSSGGTYIKYTCNDKITANLFLKIYDIENKKKTEFPPNLKNLEVSDQFISFFFGMFDADGCVCTRSNKDQQIANGLKIEVHKNWFDTLCYIQQKLLFFYKIESQVKYTSRGYAKLMITKYEYLKQLKQIAISLQLPILKRKWDKIDLNYTAKKNIFKTSIPIIEEFLKDNKSWEDISHVLGLKEGTCKRNYQKYLKDRKNI